MNWGKHKTFLYRDPHIKLTVTDVKLDDLDSIESIVLQTLDEVAKGDFDLERMHSNSNILCPFLLCFC